MNTELWHANIQVTESVVNACIQAQFSDLLPIQSIRCIGEGWDNKVFLLNETIVFRFPRRKIGVQLIERENNLLKNLESMFNLDIPNPKYIGHPTEHYPYPFQGYPMLHGISGCHAHLSDEQRVASLPKLGHFLKKLHSIDETKALSLGAKSQVFDRTNANKLIDALRERVDKIIDRKLFNVNKVILEQEITAAQKIKLPYDNKCLVQGDLYCRHLLFNEGELAGIIDWGDAGINNKSVDLSVMWSFYPSNCHALFFELYGIVDTATWQYARFVGLYIMFTTLLYGDDINDALLVAESMNAIKRINPDLFAS